MRLDHVIYGVRDLEAAAARLRREHGLGALPGGEHAEHGTANWVVPLEPPLYVELLAAVDPAKEWGRLVAGATAAGDRLLGWGVSGVDDLDAVAHRLGLPVRTEGVELPGGGVRTWRMVLGDFALPLFVSYDFPEADRVASWAARYEQARHDASPGGFAWLEVGGDEEELRAWLGNGGELPLVLAGGPRGPRAVGIAAPGGEIVLR